MHRGFKSLPLRQNIWKILFYLSARLSMDSLVERVAARSRRGALDMRLVQQQAFKAIKGVKPKRNHDGTVKALAAALTKNDVVMDYLHEAAEKYGRNGKLDYHTLPDLLGDLMWRWRESWEVPEDEDSYAEGLKGEIQKKLDKYEPKGARLSGWDAVNLGEMERLVSNLNRSIENMGRKYARDKALEKAKDEAAMLVKLLDDVE